MNSRLLALVAALGGCAPPVYIASVRLDGATSADAAADAADDDRATDTAVDAPSTCAPTHPTPGSSCAFAPGTHCDYPTEPPCGWNCACNGSTWSCTPVHLSGCDAGLAD